MSFPDAFSSDMVLGPDQILPTVPRGFGERFDLEWKAARAPDKWYFFETRMRDLWDDALEKLHKATGQRFRNPYPADPLRRDDPFTDVLAAFDQARAGQFDLPDPRRFEDKIRDEATKLRQDAQRSALASYGAGGLGAFLGAASGELSHPVNLATLPIGGAYATGNIARLGLLRFLGRNALIEGGVAMASQTAIEIADAPYQERLATDTGLEDRLERIFIAGAGGAILGMGLSGLVAAARGVRKRLNPTLDEADAIKVAERATLHEGKNPLGPEGGIAHSRALETAEVQVAAGRHAEVRAIVREEMSRQRVAPREDMAAPADFKPSREDLEFARQVLEGRLGPAPKEPQSLSQFVRAKGGINVEDDLAGDLRAMDIGNLSGLLRKRREGGVKDMQGAKERLGRGADEMAETAWAEGFYHERPTREQFIADLIDDHQGGRKIYADIDRAAEYEAHLTDERNFQHYLENLPFNPRGMTEREIAWRLSQAPAARATDVDSVPFDPFDPATTRAIAAAAPVPPEKAAASAKAEVEIANARAIAETDAEAKAALEAADEEAKMANRIKNCAMGVAIG